MEVDEALGKLGIRGRWQILHLMMIGVAGGVPACFHMIAIIFLGNVSLGHVYCSLSLQNVKLNFQVSHLNKMCAL